MVKFSNKGKGKPTKRKTLKTKYKIQRKVKQHKKKMRREAKKLGQKGIKPKRNEKNNMLPNSYPFKMQILEKYKSEKPIPESSPNQALDSAQWGLVALQNNPRYLPKDKDHLTKKYFTNQTKIFEHANLVLEVLDARNVNECIDKSTNKKLVKSNIKVLSVITKIDTISTKKLENIRQQLTKMGKQFVYFTFDQKKKSSLLDKLIQKVVSNDNVCYKAVVVGKALTGKHSLIKQLMKSVKFHNEDYASIYDVQIRPNFRLVDTPYKIQDKSEYPLFHIPCPLNQQQSLMSQQQKILKYLFIDNSNLYSKLDKSEILLHYFIQKYNSLDDFLKKVGKASRIFGKGGMVDVGHVRTKILTEWYSGKLNHLFD